jgi:hypothetical protein
MKPFAAFILIFSLSGCDLSCKGESQRSSKPSSHLIRFDEDYSYQQILEYEKFGPKIPGSAAHTKTGDWIVQVMKQFGMDVLEQKTTVTGANGTKIPVRNIIARHLPNAKKRVLLSAHWDNRPFADQDPKHKTKPVPGVNDGGSGVAVLMTIAKALHESQWNQGIDFAFWDAEDGGIHTNPRSYCLGSQYWAFHPVPDDYSADFGMNFDMVGRKGSVFPIEAYSWFRAPEIIKSLKNAAQKLGYQDYFPDYRIGPVVDDHYFVSEVLGFPMIDLIYMTEDGKFSPEWHTVSDTSEWISRDVMKAVGQTTIQMLQDRQ